MGGNVEMLIYGLEVRFFLKKVAKKFALENFLLKNDIFFAKKFAKYNLFIVSLQRRSKEDRARKRDVRSANEMRMKMNRNNQDYESRIDNSYRKFTRCVEEGWLLLPDMQRTADRAKMSEEMDGYAGTKSGTGKIH